MTKTSSLRKHMVVGLALLWVGMVLLGCAGGSDTGGVSAASDEMDHAMVTSDTHTPELSMASPIELNPAAGTEIGAIYQSFLSPEQEGDDEENTPEMAPAVFKSTGQSVPRVDRTSHGHGVLSFTQDLSSAFVHVAVENVDPDEIVMFHIHCGRPGQLGPIAVDFGLKGNLSEYFVDGVFSAQITNEDIVATADHGKGIVGAFTAGCPIHLATPLDKVKTVGGLKFIADQGELYFNLHTESQKFFGDIRGQLERVDGPVAGSTNK